MRRRLAALGMVVVLTQVGLFAGVRADAAVGSVQSHGSTVATVTNGTNVTAHTPRQARAGDLLVAIVAMRVMTEVSDTADRLQRPAGWLRLLDSQQLQRNRLELFQRVAGEPAESFPFEFTTAVNAVVTIVSYRNVDIHRISPHGPLRLAEAERLATIPDGHAAAPGDAVLSTVLGVAAPAAPADDVTPTRWSVPERQQLVARAGTEGRLSSATFAAQPRDPSTITTATRASRTQEFALTASVDLPALGTPGSVAIVGPIDITASDPDDASHVDVRWTTNVAATPRVEFGLTETYGRSVELGGSPAGPPTQPTAVLRLDGLKTNTTYHLRVISTDALGARIASDDQTFTTRSQMCAGSIPASTSTSTGPTTASGCPGFDRTS